MKGEVCIPVHVCVLMSVLCKPTSVRAVHLGEGRGVHRQTFAALAISSFSTLKMYLALCHSHQARLTHSPPE